MQLPTKDVVRFWKYVQKGPGCWPWVGGRFPFGHGSFWLKGKNVKASRVAWVLKHGPIPAGQNVLHKCDNPPCCNPDHLFLGTLADNNADAKAKGRTRGGAPPGEGNGKSKLRTADVLEIRRAHAAGEARSAIARRLGVSHSAVGGVLSGRTWRHVA